MYLYDHPDEISRDEVEFKNGMVLDRYSSPVFGTDGQYYGRIWTFRDVTERKAAQEQIARQNSRLLAINQLFEKAISCGSMEELGRMCLALAEGLTASKFGFVGELNERGRLDTVALSDPGWNTCRIPEATGAAMIQDMEIRGLWGRVIKDGRCVLVNEPKSHPDVVGVPESHTPITAFLGVPLKHAGETFGMLALANKEGGYDLTDQEDAESLAVTFGQALMRTRAETALRTSEQRYRELLAAVTNYTYTVQIKDGVAVATNHSSGCLSTTGYAPEDYASDRNLWFSMVHPDDREMVRPHVGKVLAGEDVPPMEHRILRKDGATRWVRDAIVCHRDAAGQLVRYDGLVEDITERKRAVDVFRVL
jgi:PAS domain S-box-containing protein